MKKFVNAYRVVIILFLITILTVCISYKVGISPVSKIDKTITFEITTDSTYLSIAHDLKEKGLIRSESFYKIYVKIFKPNNLQKGTYELNQNMGVKKIIDKLEGHDALIDSARFTIPEGKHITDVASIISNVTNYSVEQLLEYWQSSEFIDKVITKYWFIDDDIKNPNLRYALEGYFFPATYDILKDATIEDISYKMLDKMSEVLNKYKEEITKSSLSIHELLTLSSIVEYEAVLDEDRAMIAGVFYNRLNKNMLLQSCATVGYAIDEWKLSYTNKDLATDSLYNTYKYAGLPIGPGGLPSENSIKAALFYSEHDYLYFLANVYDENDKKTYYSKTYSEHQQKCRTYLGRAC